MRVATVFSGIGAPEQALKNLGIQHEVVLACEIDKYARKTYLANFTTPQHYFLDVKEINGLDFRGKIDLLVGGSPCQDFSINGTRQGAHGDRGALIYEFFRLIKEIRPSTFIYENVKGFLSIHQGDAFKDFKNSLEGLGYAVEGKVLNSKDFGLPQSRERIYLVGRPKDSTRFRFPHPKETMVPMSVLLEKEVDESYYFKDISTFVEEPNERKSWIKRAGYFSHMSREDSRRVYSPDGVSPTITTNQGGQKAPKIKVGDRIRYLTPWECLWFQGFPKDFKTPVSKTQILKQAGNAMSVNVVQSLLMSMFLV